MSSRKERKGKEKMTKGHDLKISPVYYENVLSGRKKFEIRFNDRDFNIGDTVNLHWFDSKIQKYSIDKPAITRTIQYITAYEHEKRPSRELRGPSYLEDRFCKKCRMGIIRPGYVVFSI